MANKDAAFGLKPIGKVGQNDDNQGLSEYKTDNTNNSAIFFQDPVKALAAGTIGVAAAGDVLLGSFNGCFFTDSSTSKPTFANHLSANNAATDIVGFVADDPYERVEIQSDHTLASEQTDVFRLYNIIYTAGDSANNVSKVEWDDSTTSTVTNQLKVMGVSKNPDGNDLTTSNVNFVVTINEHFYKAAVAGV